MSSVPLARLADVTMGQSPDSHLVGTGDHGLPFLQGSAEFGRISPKSILRCARPPRKAKAGSILISVRAPVGEMNDADQDYCIGRGLGAFTAKPGISNTIFLKHAVEQNLSWLRRRSQGSTFDAISANDLRSLPVPDVAPRCQDKAAAIFEAADAAIRATEALIKKYQEIKAGLMNDLFLIGERLPIGWRWAPLGDLARVVSGVTLGGVSPRNGVVVPYLRVANVQDGYLALEVVKTIRVSRSVLEELRLLPGDVLMNEGGDFDKLGRGTVWSGEIDDCIHQNHVFRVRTNRSLLNPEYLAFHSECHHGKRYFLISSKQSTNLASINATQLRRYPIALPPLNEQARIVAQLSAAKAHLTALERSVAKLRAQKLGLMQDLLTGKVRVPAARTGGRRLMPTCWIIAGPNGAGKTTFALQYLPLVAKCRNFINADLIAAGLSPLAPALQQAAAGRLLLREVQANIQRRTDFALETTLAGRGYLKLVDRLRADGWRVELIYLALPDKAMSHQRVAERVAEGGHDIPAADIERRFARSLRHLLNDFSHRVDRCECFLNSSAGMELVFRQTGATRSIHHPAHYQRLVEESKP